MLVVALRNRERSSTAAWNQIHLQARLGFIGQICLPSPYHRVSRGRWRLLPVYAADVIGWWLTVHCRNDSPCRFGFYFSVF
jgi:hypothetical protein